MKKELSFLVVVMFLSVGIIVFFSQRFHKTMENQIAEQVVESQVLLAKTGAGQIMLLFERAREGLIRSADSVPLHNLFAAIGRNDYRQASNWKMDLADFFSKITESYEFVSQLSLIDPDGLEVVRTDKGADGKVYPAKILQDKSKEPYFTKAMSLDPNQLYLSPASLNREFGEKEVPHREVIQLARPVIYNKEKKGIIVMNIDMNVIYRIVDNISGHAWLFDTSGKLLTCSIGLPQEDHDSLINLIRKFKKDSFSLPLDYYHETGERFIIGVSTLKILDQTFYVVAELPFDEISSIMAKSNRIRLILSIIILVVAVSVLIYFYKLYSDRQRAELKAVMAEDLIRLNKQLEQKSQELETANHTLEEIDKRKTDFLNMVAHDLRTPLTSIRSYSDLLLRYGDPSNKSQEEYAGIIKKESIRLSKLIDSFLDISKIEAGLVEYKREELDIRELIDHLVKVFQGEGNANKISIISEVEEGLPHILGDNEKLGQVLSNLLSNAIKFTPSNGSIKVKACLIKINNNGVDTPYLQISVSDTGIGIPKESLDHVFEKFYQINQKDIKATRGVGLGLTISKDIIEQHGGEIKVESVVGKGTTFTFTLSIGEKQHV